MGELATFHSKGNKFVRGAKIKAAGESKLNDSPPLSITVGFVKAFQPHCIPVLPHGLSNKICSIGPHVPCKKELI